jgi:putative nucleotidyltransferase with HDIG domain
MTPALNPEIKNLLKIVDRFAKKKKVKLYLVGGYLRDIILKREKDNPDIDFCLKKKAIDFARLFAREMRCGFVVLDKEHGCARLVKRIKDKAYTLDFTDFRGKTLADDLLHRDFTINAIALELEKIFAKQDLTDFLIDPYAGVKDLKAKIIRMVAKTAIDLDPLRILRAFSLAAIFSFKIDKETLRIIKLKRKKLSGVSFERIRDELFKILDRPDAFGYLVNLDKLGILKIIFPEIEMMRGVSQGPYHHLDVWKHTLETVRQLGEVIKKTKNNLEIQNYLNVVISGERRRRALIKLGALLHDIGKPKAKRREEGKTKFHGHERIGLEMTKDIAQRLKLSNDELDSLEKMVYWHLRPGYLADIEKITPRAKFRYFRDSAQEGVSILLISIADQRSTKGPLTSEVSRKIHEKVSFNLIKEYFRKKKEKKMPRIINGNDLMKAFKLPPSPLIGKILCEIEELQAIGKIKSKKEALEIASRFIRTH